MSIINITPKLIDLSVADTFLDKYNTLYKLVERKKTQDYPGIDEFILNKKNSFVFTVESFEDLIGKGATHIVVALGAHTDDDPVNKVNKGSFTVMAIGYEKDNTYAGNGTRFKVINDPYPAYEYPPKVLIEDLSIITLDDKKLDKSLDISFDKNDMIEYGESLESFVIP